MGFGVSLLDQELTATKITQALLSFSIHLVFLNKV